MQRCQALALVLLSHLHCSLFSLYLWTSHIQSTWQAGDGGPSMFPSLCVTKATTWRPSLSASFNFLEKEPQFYHFIQMCPLGPISVNRCSYNTIHLRIWGQLRIILSRTKSLRMIHDTSFCWFMKVTASMSKISSCFQSSVKIHV